MILCIVFVPALALNVRFVSWEGHVTNDPPQPASPLLRPLLWCLAVQLVGLFDEVDDDHDGYLHYTEFLAATLETDGKEVTDDRLAEAFDQLDMDDSGFISRENLVEFLGKDSKVRRACQPHYDSGTEVLGTCQPGVMFGYPPLQGFMACH